MTPCWRGVATVWPETDIGRSAISLVRAVLLVVFAERAPRDDRFFATQLASGAFGICERAGAPPRTGGEVAPSGGTPSLVRQRDQARVARSASRVHVPNRVPNSANLTPVSRS